MREGRTSARLETLRRTLRTKVRALHRDFPAPEGFAWALHPVDGAVLVRVEDVPVMEETPAPLTGPIALQDLEGRPDAEVEWLVHGLVGPTIHDLDVGTLQKLLHAHGGGFYLRDGELWVVLPRDVRRLGASFRPVHWRRARAAGFPHGTRVGQLLCEHDGLVRDGRVREDVEELDLLVSTVLHLAEVSPSVRDDVNAVLDALPVPPYARSFDALREPVIDWLSSQPPIRMYLFLAVLHDRSMEGGGLEDWRLVWPDPLQEAEDLILAAAEQDDVRRALLASAWSLLFATPRDWCMGLLAASTLPVSTSDATVVEGLVDALRRAGVKETVVARAAEAWSSTLSALDVDGPPTQSALTDEEEHGEDS